MTPQKLKNSIIQYAMQGKLVSQKASEGNAIEYYKDRIKFEILNSDDIPFDIPDNWIFVKHNDLFDIVGGSQPPKSEFSEIQKEGYVRLYQIRDYGDSPVPIYVDKNKVTKFSKKGEIILARYGASGKVFWAEDGAYNVALAKSIPKYEGELIYKPYIYYYYQSSFYQDIVCNTTRVAVDGFNKDDICNMLFPLPPYEEQKRIVSKIEEILPYVEQYKIAWKKLNHFNEEFPSKMKKSILQYAIQGKLVSQNPTDGNVEVLFEEIQKEKSKLIAEKKIKKEKNLLPIEEEEKPFEIPETWKWVRLQEIGELNRGRSKHRPRNDSILYENGYFPLIQTGDVARANGLITEYSSMYNDVGIEQSRVWEKGTLCLTIAANIGDVAILDFDACFPDSVVGFNAFKPLKSNKFFMYGLMCYKDILDKMAHSVAQKNINIEILSKIAFPLPPIEEQERIVKRIEELLPLCDSLIK